MEIIDTFIPTLKYCGIIIKFSNSKTVYLFLYDSGRYCIHFPNNIKGFFSHGRNHEKEEEEYFDTQKDLSDKVKTYVELYGIDSIEIEGERGPSTYVYKK